MRTYIYPGPPCIHCYWRVVSFPKSQKITSFTVINKRGFERIASYFINTPYTIKTGYPDTSRSHSIGSYNMLENKFVTSGTGKKKEKSGIPKWINKNDSFTITKRSKFIDFDFTTSSGNSTVTVDPSQYGTYDVENMTPVIEMFYKDTDILITNIRDADNPFC